MFCFRWEEFEPQSVWDYVLLPWWLLRWGLCWPLWRVQLLCWRHFGRPWCLSRHNAWEPVICTRCGYAGPERWLFHTYEGDGCGDVEPVDECPRCGAIV